MPYELPFADVAHVVAEANEGEEHARVGQALRIYDTVRLAIGTASGWQLIARLGSVADCELHVIHPKTGIPVFADSPTSSRLPASVVDQISQRLSDRSGSGNRPHVVGGATRGRTGHPGFSPSCAGGDEQDGGPA
jgi:hypothetical protein